VYNGSFSPPPITNIISAVDDRGNIINNHGQTTSRFIKFTFSDSKVII
jgi:hypothetical protein